MHNFASGLCLLLLAAFLSTSHSRSIQGTDQARDVHDSEMFKAFESKFLGKLGLKSKPRIRRGTVVPQYMLDLYNSIEKDENYITTNLRFKDFATTANTVRAFYHRDVRDESDARLSGSSKRVMVDLKDFPSDEDLVKAEFRVFRNASMRADGETRTVHVYQILQPGVGKGRVKRLLDSHIVNATSDGWESLNVLEAVRHWRERPSENYGLEVDMVSENGYPVDISHLRFERPRELEEATWPHHRPLVTVFSHDPKTHYHKKRVRRNSRPKPVGHCKRHDLVVDAKELNWDKWLISPQQYNAYYCQGACVYPLADHMNATNHAIVQTLVHSVKRYKNKVPPACCVPTSFDSVNMLYFDQNGEVNIKNYHEMIVTGCGCR